MAITDRKEEILALIRKAENKQKTAVFLFENGQFDDAVSRAYYSAFHAITAILFWKGFTFSTHGQTIGAFNREFIKNGIFPKEFSLMIQDLYENRQIGDYDPDQYLDKELAEINLLNAEKILKTIKEYLNNELEKKLE